MKSPWENLKIFFKAGAFLFAILFCFSAIQLSQIERAFGQASEEDEQKIRSQKRFLYLTQGIEYEEKLPKMPSVVTFKGDFREITKATFIKELNIIRFTPKKTGVGSLTVHDKTGKLLLELRLAVRQSAVDTVAREVQSLLGDIEGINIKIVNNRVVIDGQVLLPRDFNRIFAVANQFKPDQVSFPLVSLSPLAQKKIAELIARDINNPEIEVRAVNDKIIMQGQASSSDEKERAMVIAKTYLPAYFTDFAESNKVLQRNPNSAREFMIIDLITVKQAPPPPPGKTVQVVVHYVEMNKNYLRGFRFQFMPDLNDKSGLTFTADAGSGSGVNTSFTGTITNLLPKLNWAKSHGYARILESVSILTQDGKEASLNSETAQYITTAQPNGQSTVSAINSPFNTTVTPFVIGERSDSIDLEINFTISAATGVNEGNGALTSKNSMKTRVIIRSGQSAAIGGLIRNNTITDYNKRAPGVSGNPIVSLLASKEFTRGQSQFVVFVTPVIKSSASTGSDKIKKKFRIKD